MCEIRGTEVNKCITASKVYLLTNIGERGFICACGRMWGGYKGGPSQTKGLLPGPRSSTVNSTTCQKGTEGCWSESNYLVNTSSGR